MLMACLQATSCGPLILIEDVDCAIPQDRAQLPEHEIKWNRELFQRTLSDLLDTIEGVGAQEGCLLFMTANHIEKFDVALIRHGRSCGCQGMF